MILVGFDPTTDSISSRNAGAQRSKSFAKSIIALVMVFDVVCAAPKLTPVRRCAIMLTLASSGLEVSINHSRVVKSSLLTCAVQDSGRSWRHARFWLITGRKSLLIVRRQL